MSELKLISPLLDNMETVTCLQSGSGTSVFLLRGTLNGQEYILKRISVPESQTQVEALYFAGAAEDEEEAKKYFEQLIKDYCAELSELDMLRGSTNFATYLDYQVCEKEDGIGYDLYLLSEKWQTLVEYLSENAMTHLKALNLGLDLCTALCDLRTHGLIHRDIKPENIYLNGLNSFMLGDLGVAKIAELKYCTMPERMVTEYTAPEMTDILNPFNTTIDIYSIGMVLYRILNGNHGPFEDEKTSAKAANKLRISGEPLPAPLYSDYELTDIIMKACAFLPEDRYQTPEEFMQDLVLYMKRNNVTDSLIVPPLLLDPEDIVHPDAMDEEVQPVQFAEADQMDEQFISSFMPDTTVQGSEEDIEVTPSSPPPDTPLEDSPWSQLPELGDLPSFAAPHAVDPAEEVSAAPPPPIAPKKKQTNKGKKLAVAVSAAVVALGVIGVSAYFLVVGGPATNIASITMEDRGTDYLVVSVKAGSNASDLTLHCVDTYGNEQTAELDGSSATFSELSPGTQYTVSVVSNTGHRLSGTTSAMFTTVATTDVLSFVGTAVAGDQVTLQLTVSGPSPEEWTVRYFAEGITPQEKTFTGNSVTITGLESGAVYLFELSGTSDVELTGTTSLELTTTPQVAVSDLAVSALTETSATVSWTSTEPAPAEWTVTCAGTDGSVATKTVTDCEVEFTELTAGETYTISVTADGLTTPAVITATPTSMVIDGFTATASADGSVSVSWNGGSETASWQLRYAVAATGSPITGTLDVQGNETTLEHLIPGEKYTLELRSAAGEKLGGTTTAEVTIPAGGSFNQYDASRFFLGLFKKPAKSNWTANDLVTMSEPVFSSSESIVFAMESLTGRSDSEDEVTLLYVVESATGVPLSTGSKTATWDTLWTGDLILGQVDETPQEAGTYTLRLYLNGQSAATKEFTVQ